MLKKKPDEYWVFRINYIAEANNHDIEVCPYSVYYLFEE
jgi:hypothetical protein